MAEQGKQRIIDCMEEHYVRGACTREEAATAALKAIGWPDLLAACEAAEPYLPSREQVLDYASSNEGQASSVGVAAERVRAAIAKATASPIAEAEVADAEA